MRPEQPLRFRGTLVVFAAAFIATAGLLAFSGDDPSDTTQAAAAQSTDDAAGARVVRARGRGVATPNAATAAPEPAAVRVLAIRAQAEDEVRDRIGEDEADTPEGEDAIDEIVELVEDGASLEEAVEDVVGPREDPEASPAPPLPLP